MKTVTSEQLRHRMIRSLVAGAIFVVCAAGTFYAIRHEMPVDGLPRTLRSAQVFNESVGRKLYSNQNRAPLKPVPQGRAPRVNGLIGLESDVDSAGYHVKVESGATRLAPSIDELMALPRTESSTDFKCVEGWTEVFHYAGVKFSDFMTAYKVGRHEDGSLFPYVGLEPPDGDYYVSIDIESMMNDQTVLAFEMNGGELSLENGYPIRLMIPNKYGIKNLKRIGRIFFSDTRPPDYWHRRGYDWYSSL